MARTPPWGIGLAAGLAAPFGIYILMLLLGSVPYFQRLFMYAHKFNTLFWHDVDKPEYWGFATNQVTPFSINTADGETLYSWHVLPLRTYMKHESRLQSQKGGFCADVTSAESFKILKDDPEARLIIYFHGNAGHIAQAVRTDAYHTLTDTSDYHLLAIDYRGFGKSTGTPTENGLIHDGVAAVGWAMDVAGIPSDRIVIMGQSLGTAVTSGVAEHFAMQGVEFAGIILIAGFSDMQTLLSSYTAAGFIPILSPIRTIPPLLRFLHRFILDEWKSADRLTNVVSTTRNRLRLTLIHAKDDLEIPCHESDALFKYASSATMGGELDDDQFGVWKEGKTTRKQDGSFVSVVTAKPDIVIRQELVRYGGHNGIMLSSQVALAVLRSFEPETEKPSV
ncbi:hypothetical protein DL769_009654 [Monosporascus sp. CRB-8-3]|nr:hypothetical protein DL769_009654 [Monosporascus sp. CRB-8-3]